MKRESVDEVKAAFEQWRSKKRHLREAMPAALLDRARQAARRHGWAAVARATKVDRSRLESGHRSRGGTPTRAEHVPAFSRVQVAAPTSTFLPFAELEVPTGLKLRLFSQTEAAVALLASLCGPAGAR